MNSWSFSLKHWNLSVFSDARFLDWERPETSQNCHLVNVVGSQFLERWNMDSHSSKGQALPWQDRLLQEVVHLRPEWMTGVPLERHQTWPEDRRTQWSFCAWNNETNHRFLRCAKQNLEVPMGEKNYIYIYIYMNYTHGGSFIFSCIKHIYKQVWNTCKTFKTWW